MEPTLDKEPILVDVTSTGRGTYPIRKSVYLKPERVLIGEAVKSSLTSEWAFEINRTSGCRLFTTEIIGIIATTLSNLNSLRCPWE